MYMLSWYLGNKIAVGLNTASELGAGTPNHVLIHSGENLSDGGHQACLNVIGMSIGMIIKFALDKIAHQLKICAHFGHFMTIKLLF